MTGTDSGRTRLIALLRAINVGGHVVKMDALCAIVASLGFEGVETFLASGNVIFDGRAAQARTAEKKIEQALRRALGYDVATFVRTNADVSAIAAHQAFGTADMQAAQAFNVAFLKDPLDEAATRRLLALRSEVDDFHTHAREVYWLCRLKQSDSRFSNVVFERATGVSATFRSITTIQKLAAKYPPGRVI